MTLQKFRDYLVAISEAIDVYHFEALEKNAPYMVWQEEGAGKETFYNNRMKTQTLVGSIDFYTTVEFDPNFDLIQTQLNEICEGWSLLNIIREEDTKLIHYEWSWEIVYGKDDNSGN